LSKISKAYSKLEQEFEREPSPEELADTLETTADKISDTLSNSGRHISMDAPFVQGEENTLLDVLENPQPNTDSILINESLSEEIKRSLLSLTEREQQIISLFFGITDNQPLSLEEIGEMFGLTRERVRQIKDKALQRLRHASRSKILKSYLG
jgi:RNA polymerase primary sigma factor